MAATVPQPVPSPWTRFLHAAAPRDHGARIYANSSELAESVATYLATGFDLGEPAIVIATPEHWLEFAERLATCGWGETEIRDSGLLFVADADSTLEALFVDGALSAPRFEEVVGRLLDETEQRFPGRSIRAFGEMVDLLCRRGDAIGAAALESMWNDYGQRRPFALLCGYRLDVFDPAAQTSVLPQVCRAHTHIRPAEDSTRLQWAVDSAMEEALGTDAGKVYSLAVDQAMTTGVLPTAQLVLMWISEHMPSHAERILAAARRNYAKERRGA